MSSDAFRAVLVEEEDGTTAASIRTLTMEDLPQGDVLVAVEYSSMNYKDGLALAGNQGRVIRTLPMVPGIDLSGTVVESAASDFSVGEGVVLTGWGIGELHWGGYAGYARVQSDWLIPLPGGLSTKEAMTIGTAGFTAMLGVMAMERQGARPDGREVVVTGAAGGVGSVAVALLANLGYRVVASTGRPELHRYLRELGAEEIIRRQALLEPTRPLESERWAGALDTVGGDTLAGLLRSMAHGASIAVCGLAGGRDLHTTVLPFILRGVNLLGIDSVRCPNPERREAWSRLARELPRDRLQWMATTIPLDEVFFYGREILRGQVRGRIVVDVQAPSVQHGG